MEQEKKIKKATPFYDVGALLSVKSGRFNLQCVFISKRYVDGKQKVVKFCEFRGDTPDYVLQLCAYDQHVADRLDPMETGLYYDVYVSYNSNCPQIVDSSIIRITLNDKIDIRPTMSADGSLSRFPLLAYRLLRECKMEYNMNRLRVKVLQCEADVCLVQDDSECTAHIKLHRSCPFEVTQCVGKIVLLDNIGYSDELWYANYLSRLFVEDDSTFRWQDRQVESHDKMDCVIGKIPVLNCGSVPLDHLLNYPHLQYVCIVRLATQIQGVSLNVSRLCPKCKNTLTKTSQHGGPGFCNRCNMFPSTFIYKVTTQLAISNGIQTFSPVFFPQNSLQKAQGAEPKSLFVAKEYSHDMDVDSSRMEFLSSVFSTPISEENSSSLTTFMETCENSIKGSWDLSIRCSLGDGLSQKRFFWVTSASRIR